MTRLDAGSRTESDAAAWERHHTDPDVAWDGDHDLDAIARDCAEEEAEAAAERQHQQRRAA